MIVPYSRVDEVEFGGQKYPGSAWRATILCFLEARYAVQDPDPARRVVSLRLGPVTLREVLSGRGANAVSRYFGYRNTASTVPPERAPDGEETRLVYSANGTFELEMKLAWLASSDRGSNLPVPCRLEVAFPVDVAKELGSMQLIAQGDTLLVCADGIPVSVDEFMDLLL